MMDVREKLIELLDDMQRSGTGYFGSAIENKKIADYLIRHGVTVQDWVSVDDRLPEYSNDGFADAVLVTDGFVQHMAYFIGGEWRFAESGEIKEPMWYRITHWMPLPLEPEVKND